MIKNITKNTIIAQNELIAVSFIERGFGLIVKKFIPQKMDAIIFYNCSALHSFFINYKFDIFFVDKSKKVITLYKDAAPWRIFTAKCKLFQKCTAVECPTGTIEKTMTQLGDILDWNSEKTEIKK